MKLPGFLVHRGDGKSLPLSSCLMRFIVPQATGRSPGEDMLKHLGSTIAIVLGVLMIATIAMQPQGSLHIAGAVTVLGALAYRSCKRRKLGEVRSTVLRQGLEILALVIAVLLVVLRPDLKNCLILDPVPNILPIVWILAAYAVASFRRYSARTPGS
jgi:hypothetical protein